MAQRSIKTWQEEVDTWIKEFGVRYFDVKTNGLLLAEETGEVCRLLARMYGEQSSKIRKDDAQMFDDLKEELGDLFFVLTCICNQLEIDIEEALDRSMNKKNIRDRKRHSQNRKLQSN